MPTRKPSDEEVNRGCGYLVMISSGLILIWGLLVFVSILGFRFAMAW